MSTKGQPRISVIIITYNQENIIARAIEALLRQRDYIYEICISDDCSTDQTWEILNDYSDKYPGLFKLHQNNPNLGIFENIEQAWTMPTGDLIYDQAGDDEVGPDWFVSVIDFIKRNNIHIHEKKICFLGDYKCVYPNGDSIIIMNKYANSNIDKLKLYERGLLFNRSRIVTKTLFNSYVKVSQGRSYIVENAQDCQTHLFSDQTYYIPKVGNIYYCAIGVSANMSPQRIKEHEQTMVYAFDFIKSVGRTIDSKDLALPQYNIARKHFIKNKNLSNAIKYFAAYIRCFDISVSLKIFDIRHFLFRVLRRLPHKQSINW